MAADDILRMRYRERQFLRARDFEDEQEYFVESRRRHQIGEHTWGIVTGLKVDKNDSDIWVVSAGFAVDAYGREIYLFEDEPLDVARITADLAQSGEPSLKLWIAYVIEPTAPAKGTACNDELLNSRTRESFELVYQDDPRPFDGAPPAPPVAYQDLPDDPDTAPWPVFLGTIQWANNEIGSVDPAGRTYAGLRGVEVFSETGQFDVHASTVRIITGGADDATLTTDAKKTLHLSTAGNGEVFVDKDNLHVKKDALVDGKIVVKETIGDGTGKVRVEVDGTGLAVLTRPANDQNAASKNLALRTNDGAGGNTVLVDVDDFACAKTLVVDGEVTVKSGITLQGGQIVLEEAGGNNTDPMSISRVNNGFDKSDLRVRLGDNQSGDDRFLIGPMINNNFLPKFTVDNAGHVTTAGNVNGRDMAADGAKLAGISAGANRTTVAYGVVLDGNTIPIPTGYTAAQCTAIVSPAWPLDFLERPTIGVQCFVNNATFEVTMKWRVIISIFSDDFTLEPGWAQYLIVGVK